MSDQERAQEGAGVVFAADPGADTGWALWRPGVGLTAWGELPADEFCDWAERMVPAVDEVVCEAFDITPATLKKSRGERAWSIEQIGVLRHLARRAGVPFTLWRPSQTKKLVTDRRLDAVGWRHPTVNGHQDDACRVLLYHLAKRGTMRLET